MVARWSSALVTGASSGIGEAMARHLASQGTALTIVARSTGRLEVLASALPVEVEVLTADLATAEGVATVADRLRDDDRPVDLLVNNAGFGASTDFVEHPPELVRSMVDVNVVAVAVLTRAALPGMLERGRGSIVNVSSIASLQPSPGLSLYAATKAFVTTFTESLHGELAGTGVTATAVLPGLTRTGFQETAGYEDEDHKLPAFAWQSANDVAVESLAGAAHGRPTVVTGTVNKIVAAVSAPVPRSVKRRVVKEASRRFTR